MTTHRSEKTRWAPSRSRPINSGAPRPSARWSISASRPKMPGELIYALALTKRAAAKVNRDLGLLTAEKAGAIVAAADEVLAGKHAQEFPRLSGRPAPAPKAI